MNQRSRPIAAAIMIAVLAAGVSPAADAWAADSSELQEMRREVAKLRGQVQSLQTVVAEATELERQRAMALTRAMKELSTMPAAGAPVAAAPPPAAPAPGGGEAVTEMRTPSAPIASDDKPRPSSRQRRHRRAARSRSKSSSRSAATDR